MCTPLKPVNLPEGHEVTDAMCESAARAGWEAMRSHYDAMIVDFGDLAKEIFVGAPLSKWEDLDGSDRERMTKDVPGLLGIDGRPVLFMPYGPSLAQMVARRVYEELAFQQERDFWVLSGIMRRRSVDEEGNDQ